MMFKRTNLGIASCLALFASISQYSSSFASADSIGVPRPPPSGYGTISLQTNGSVTRATISNPPINLFDYKLATDMYSFLNSLIPGSATNTPPKVVIFDSADPEFFIAHLDKTIFMEPKTAEKNATFNMYLACTRLLWNITSTIFIGEVNGQGFDAANELLVQMDMRFTGPKTRVGATEIAFGITQGAGGLQFMNRLVNRGRAFEYILTGNNIDGPTAAAIGWANHYYDNARDLTNAVNALAHRIALFPASGINITKVGLNANNPSTAVLEQDKSNTEALISQPENGILEGKFYALSENQTRSPFELGLDDTLVDIFN